MNDESVRTLPERLRAEQARRSQAEENLRMMIASNSSKPAEIVSAIAAIPQSNSSDS